MLDILWNVIGANWFLPFQQHGYRMTEGEAGLQRQLIEQSVANGLRKEFEVFHQELTAKADAMRARRQVETAEEIDLNRRFADNNPFYDPIGYVQKSLFASYADEQKPIMLISPFWDETQTNVAADAGGLSHFRTPVSRAWRNSSWAADFVDLDGFFKRSLRQTDRDVRIIYETLCELPIILVHGFLDGHRAYPSLATWNVIPGEGRQLIRIDGEGVLPSEGESFTAPQFRDELGRRVSSMCGLIGAAYYRLRDGRPIQRELFVEIDPRLSQWFDVIDGLAEAPLSIEEPEQEADGFKIAIPEKYERYKQQFDREPTLIVPGYGAHSIRLGTHRNEVIGRLGIPDKDDNEDGVLEFWKSGITLNTVEGQVVNIALWSRSRFLKFANYNGATPEGVGVSSRRSDVHNKLGEPIEANGSSASYDGISFHFKNDNTIGFISVSFGYRYRRSTIGDILKMHRPDET
jgi:hypothetical protein